MMFMASRDSMMLSGDGRSEAVMKVKAIQDPKDLTLLP